MPDETISFYFNALFISGWALVSDFEGVWLLMVC